MARKIIQIHNAEAAIIQSMLAERDAVTRAIAVAVNMVCARHNVEGALFVGLIANEIQLEMPDELRPADELRADPKPFRGDDTRTLPGVVGGIPAASSPKNPSESKPDGKKGDSKPGADAPDAGLPAVPDNSHPLSGVGDFRHSEASQ